MLSENATNMTIAALVAMILIISALCLSALIPRPIEPGSEPPVPRPASEVPRFAYSPGGAAVEADL